MTALIVALDTPVAPARNLFENLRKNGVEWFKIGIPTLLEEPGQRLARDIALWSKLMLDLKLYDTRDTVLRAVDSAIQIGAAMLTVHADCAVHTVEERRLKILGVQCLTDGTNDHRGSAQVALVDGVVCSVEHARFMRPHTDKLLVCPGIRPADWPAHNHLSAATPREAAEAGIDYIVVGRPIICAPDPAEAAKRIIADLEGCCS